MPILDPIRSRHSASAPSVSVSACGNTPNSAVFIGEAKAKSCPVLQNPIPLWQGEGVITTYDIWPKSKDKETPRTARQLFHHQWSVLWKFPPVTLASACRYGAGVLDLSELWKDEKEDQNWPWSQCQLRSEQTVHYVAGLLLCAWDKPAWSKHGSKSWDNDHHKTTTRLWWRRRLVYQWLLSHHPQYND